MPADSGTDSREPSGGLAKNDRGASADEELVIAGLACRFPQSPSTSEFWKNLVQGKNMVTVDDVHFPSTFGGELPAGKGHVTNQDRFDNSFFNFNPAQAAKIDPQLRFLLELSYEAVVDSGLSFQELKGGNTGVFIGSCFTDTHKAFLSDYSQITGYENTGNAQSMFANRLSYFYDWKGPSFSVDTACSSGMVFVIQGGSRTWTPLYSTI
tara:strand:+ start:2053 stop:2682 length:630 start_codon:yes stop_codon:yes gene_type:complete